MGCPRVIGVDWSLLSCGRSGHVTFAPDEPALRERLRASGPAGEAWRCLRCGTFVPGPPKLSGPVSAAPRVRRGKELRSALILRIFAIERYLRVVVFGLAAYGLWRFKYARTSLQQAFHHDIPAVRALYQDLGFDFSRSKLIGFIQHALTLNSRIITWLALGLAAYAVIELIEGTGLWLAKRWGEYFAVIATSAGLPYEIYDLTAKVTALRVAAFVINLTLVLYLVIAKRLFGVRGGKRAYEARLSEASILQAELDALSTPGTAASTQSPAQEARPAAAHADGVNK
jgi:uncharacterized membrane protein (DUF2068 family)